MAEYTDGAEVQARGERGERKVNLKFKVNITYYHPGRPKAFLLPLPKGKVYWWIDQNGPGGLTR